jgi:protein-S-isoprenylcysteine O-methyltransferase Ste14
LSSGATLHDRLAVPGCWHTLTERIAPEDRPMIFPLLQPAMLLCFVVVFTFFAFAGGQAFEYDADIDALPALLGQIVFICTGALGALVFGLGSAIHWLNGALAMGLLAASVALYEWARRTIRGRRFHLAWTGDVSDALCDQGPYAHVRHPIYLSYMLAFLALLVALPTPWVAAIFLFNLGLFVHAAFGDERNLRQGPFAREYADYRRRVGMFLPRLRRG